MQKEKIKNKNENDMKWDKLSKKLTPIFNTNTGNVPSLSNPTEQEIASSSPLDVANYISESIESNNLTKSLNLLDVILRYPQQVVITKDHVTVNGKVLSINTLDLLRNLVGSAKKKLSYAVKPLLQVISQEPDLLNCISNREARAYISSQNEPPRKRTSVMRNLNESFDQVANEESSPSSPSSPSYLSSSAKRKKGSGKKGSGKLKI